MGRVRAKQSKKLIKELNLTTSSAPTVKNKTSKPVKRNLKQIINRNRLDTKKIDDNFEVLQLQQQKNDSIASSKAKMPKLKKTTAKPITSSTNVIETVERLKQSKISH